MPRSTPRGRLTILTAIVAGTLAVGAAPAAADSIAYVKAGDVHLISPDGARHLQVTHGGGYSFVSQADDGTMIALAPGERLHRLSRTGQVLADFPTMVSDGAPQSGPVNRFHGPFEPQISPDGTKVAFEWFNDSYDEVPGCSTQTVPPCAVYAQRQGVAISHADRLTGPDAFGLMTGWIFPHWMSETTLLRSDSGRVLNDDAVFTTVGAGQGDDHLDPWMVDDQQGFGVVDVELSRDLKTVVGVAGSSDEKLRIYRTLTDPFNTPDWNHSPFAQGNVPAVERCDEATGPRFTSPSLSPDGRGLAFGTPGGIGVMALPDLSAGCTPVDGGSVKLLVPGASHPDWGPADVPAPSAPGSGGSDPGGSGAGGSGGRPGPVGPDRLTVSVRTVKLRTALRGGLVVTVGGCRDGATLLGRARAGRRAVAVGRGRCRARSARVTLRFGAVARRALRGKRSVRLTVTVAGSTTRTTLRS